MRETRRRKKDDASAGDAPGQLAPPRPGGTSAPADAPSSPAMAAAPMSRDAEQESSPSVDEPVANDDGGHADHWPTHRRLIRAALPRTEGELPPPRPIPEFTMHQRPFNRGGGFGGHRGGWHGHGNGSANGNGNGNGNVNGNVRHPQGHGRPGHGPANGHGQGPGPGPGGHGPRRHRGGKHRRPR